jgi:chloramphenicol O-acetyltransferase type B
LAAFRELRTALGLRKPRPGRHVRVGRHTYGVTEATVVHGASDCVVTIGAFCSIAAGVVIMAKADHPINLASTYPFSRLFPDDAHPDRTTKGPVVIGNDVWIGRGALVLSGVTIGDGAIIGASAVVSKDIPPFAVAVGNPAKVVKYRFPPEIAAKLLEIRWWDWPDETIRGHMDAFGGPIEDFVERFFHDGSSEAPPHA